MPTIKSSTDLRNSYNEISALCHGQDDAVFITKNGRGDLAVMSIETYNALCGVSELRRILSESRADIAAGRTRLHKDVFADFRRKYADGNL
jgi:PHD/YefM family antitoxin component YafN of YafNO toxin-antitoxin module